MESNFDNPPKIFDQKLQRNPETKTSEVWKTKKSFFKDIVLLKMFHWAHRTEVWLHCLLFSAQNLKNLALSPEMFEKKHILLKKKVYFLWRSSWPYRMQSWKIVQTFFQEVQKWQSWSSNFRKEIKNFFMDM